MVWLAQQPDDELRSGAVEAARTLDLPLTTIDVGTARLESALATALSL